MMGEIATEAAAAAMERAEHIRQETDKLATKTASKPLRPQRAQGEVISSPEKEIVTLKDLKKRGVHRIDLKDRLPWLRDSSRTADKDGQGEDTASPLSDREVVSPDSGVMESSGEGRTLELPPRDYPTAELPERDYPKLPPPSSPLPPPSSPTTTQDRDLLGDNDYYSLLLTPLVD